MFFSVRIFPYDVNMTKEKIKEVIDNQVENIETEDETRKVTTEA